MSAIEIPLTKGLCAMIDRDNLEFVMRYKWRAEPKTNGRDCRNIQVPTYAMNGNGVNSKSMHGYIMNCPKGMVVDHINGNGLDNRIENLRICTPNQNRKNVRKRASSKSPYKGVIKSGNRWRSYISIDGKSVYLGNHATAREAGIAFNIKAREVHGEYASLNAMPVSLGIKWNQPELK